MERESIHNVVITGFGLFRDNKSNPSWDAIKDDQLSIDRPNINLITKKIKVCYDAVDEIIPELWEKYNPILMVHVGLAAGQNSIRIEQVARHGPYILDDVTKKAPHKDLPSLANHEAQNEVAQNPLKSKCDPCKFDCSTTCIDVERVCEKLNDLYKAGKAPIQFNCSQDAGLYVCEYIYQTSLRICDKAIFIHVPDTGKFGLEDIRLALKLAIEVLLDTLS